MRQIEIAESFGNRGLPFAHVHEICYVHVSVNMPENVNIRTRRSASRENALANRFTELIAGIAWLRSAEVERRSEPRGRRWDRTVHVTLPGTSRAEFRIEFKFDLRPSTFLESLGAHTLANMYDKHIVVHVLGMPWVSPRVAELCEANGWSWYDLAGNYHIEIPGRVLLRHTGNPPHEKLPRPSANLGTRESARVIRALLRAENAAVRWTQRSLQADSRVSIGLVNKIARHLSDEGFIEHLHDGGFALKQPLRLLHAWREAYRFDRVEQRTCFTLFKGVALRNALVGFADEVDKVLYAAFSAADIFAPHVRQPKTWLYVRAQDLTRFEQLTQSHLVEDGENVVVLSPDDDGVFEIADDHIFMDEQRIHCTDMAQTYVDLYHCGNRGEEAAEALLEQKLKPLWKRAGLTVS